VTKWVLTVEVSFVVPAKNEEGYLVDTLESIEEQSQGSEYEIIVVDGGSKDDTVEIAGEYADKVLEGVKGRGKGRHVGAIAAEGEYIAFVDADTVLEEGFIQEMKSFMRENNLVAASSQFKMSGYRSKIMQLFSNFYFPRRDPVLLPGFFTVVRRKPYLKSSGFEDIPGEDLQFSERIAEIGETDILRDKKVKNSARRIAAMGLTRTAFYYLAKEALRRLNNIRA
jgi:glycosyltransferase involved in cell wall biosynthesis